MLSLCVCEVMMVCVRRREEEEKEPGIQNQKQEPHTKLWGKHTHTLGKALSGQTCDFLRSLNFQTLLNCTCTFPNRQGGSCHTHTHTHTHAYIYIY